ncbi:TfoX/Sxy family protein [Rickettsiales bacterium]|nr:TfoX/Sxy family protein [Rickettsiales bacterium]
MNSFVEYIIELLSPYGNIIAKSMFGGYGVYKNNIIIGIISQDELYFKVDDSNRTQYQNMNSEIFTYEARGKINKISYWKVPLEILEDAQLLEEWLEQSYQISINSKK